MLVGKIIFKWIKQHLKILVFWSYSANAVKNTSVDSNLYIPDFCLYKENPHSSWYTITSSAVVVHPIELALECQFEPEAVSRTASTF